MAPLQSAAARKALRTAASLLLLAVVADAQQPLTPLTDPANLAGERVGPQALADTLPLNHGAPALEQLLKKLRTRASMMMIVAHPDDEDGGMLTYESRGQGARVAMLTLNRGEGGQNLMSADFNDALGLIRTQELLAADRYLGVDQFFGSVVDFGFSKTREETLEQWTYQRVLYDTVRAIRLYRPLVLTSVFIGGPTDGHGQHQVSGQMNQEAFLAAADPTVFPDMGLPAWAPVKVYARVPFARVNKEGMFDYATGKSSPPRFYNYITKQWSTSIPAANVNIPEGSPALGFDGKPALGMDGLTYVQFARKGLALQKTQIGGNVRLAPAGAFDAPYTRYGTRLAAAPAKEQGFFEGIDVSLPGIADLAPAAPAGLRAALTQIDRQAEQAQHAFDPAHPGLTAAPLREALRTLDTLIANTESSSLDPIQKYNVLHELRVKRVQFNDALLLAHGMTLTAVLDAPASGQHLLTTKPSVFYKVTLANSGPDPIDLNNRGIESLGKPLDSVVKPASTHVEGREINLPPGIPPTKPYFSRPNLKQPFYTIADPALRDAPMTPYPLVTMQPLNDAGVPLQIQALVAYASGPQQGQAVVVVPPVSVALDRSQGILSPTQKTFLLTTHTTIQPGSTPAPSAASPAPTPAPATLRLESATPLEIKPTRVTLKAAPPRSVSEDTFTVTAKAFTAGATTDLTADATYRSADYREGYRPVGYPGLTTTNAYAPATYKATAVDVHTAPNLKVAYLPGTGDDVPAYLPYLGITPTIITVADLTPTRLAQFDVVLLGVRAYAAHPELAGAGSKPLLQYAAAGGVVIVQYNTARFGDPESPYPISVPGDSAHNVVVESQPVEILTPESPVLTWPNHISSQDFNGWVEELGHGFAATWDPRFQPLTETHDSDQDPQKGGLLYARVGQGAYVYVAYALYRQLPESVPGAYRLLANLLSLPRNAATGIQPIRR
jgi:LmbE family N-acetylglucosaminyl deacetylase